MSVLLISASSALVLFSYKTILSPLVDSILSTKNVISKLMTVNISNISEKLKELAVVSRIEIIRIFVSEIETEVNPTPFIKTFENLIKEITATLYTMRIALQDIETKVLYHNSLYFSRYRTLNCDQEFKTLVINNLILKEQFDTLVNILKIPQKI